MPLTAIMGGSAIFSAVEGYHASTTAATQQQQGAERAVQMEQPVSAIGQSAAARLASMYGLSVAPPGGGAPGQATVRPPIPPGSGVLPPGNPSTGFLTQYGPGWASYPVPPGSGDGTMGGLSRRPPNSSSFTNTIQ